MVAFFVQQKKRFRPLPWLISALGALALLAIAVPKLVAGYFVLSPDRIVRHISDGDRRVTLDKVEWAAGGLKRGLSFAPGDRELYNSLTTLELRKYELLAASRKHGLARQALLQAGGDIESGLQAAPGDSNLWYLLAAVRNELNRPDEKMRQALTMSYSTGPREGWVAQRRLGLALRLRSQMGPEIEGRIRADIRNLWTGHYEANWGEFRVGLIKLFLAFDVATRQIIAEETTKLGDMKRFGWTLHKLGGDGHIENYLK